jgi:hypothetical protein
MEPEGSLPYSRVPATYPYPEPTPSSPHTPSNFLKFHLNNNNIIMAIPADRNIMPKEAEKKLKYKSLGVEIQRMWNLKCTIISVIIGATGIVTKSLRKNLEAIPGKHSIDSVQKKAILGTAQTVRKVLQWET